jgi:hypothetical protein
MWSTEPAAKQKRLLLSGKTLALVVSIFAFAISRSQYILATRTYRMNGIITVWKEANSGDVKDGMRIAEQILINAGPD